MTDEGQRTALLGAAHQLLRSGVLSHSGHANLSARLPGGRILITARGTVRDLGPEDLAVIDRDGGLLQGEMEAVTREIVPMHSVVYRLRPEAAAVIHTHSPNLLAFALSCRELPCRYEAQLRLGQAVPVPVVAWAPRGSPGAVDGIAALLRASPQTQALLLGNHGVLAFSGSPSTAAGLVAVLEEAAAAEIRAVALGGARGLPPGALGSVLEALERH